MLDHTQYAQMGPGRSAKLDTAEISDDAALAALDGRADRIADLATKTHIAESLIASWAQQAKSALPASGSPSADSVEAGVTPKPEPGRSEDPLGEATAALSDPAAPASGAASPREAESPVVSAKVLFLIGLSAGAVAAVFPRVMPALMSTDPEVAIELMTAHFLYAAVALTLMVGVAMIWLYQGTREHPKNLFMAALGVPAVLSGGLNMTTMTAASEKDIGEMTRTLAAWEAKATQGNAFEPKQPPEGFDFDAFADAPLTSWVIPGISSAHAASSSEESQYQSIRIKVDALEKKYFLQLHETTSQAELDEKKQSLEQAGVRNLKKWEKGNTYYLFQLEKKTKSDALLDALKYKETLNVQPQILIAE